MRLKIMTQHFGSILSVSQQFPEEFKDFLESENFANAISPQDPLNTLKQILEYGQKFYIDFYQSRHGG